MAHIEFADTPNFLIEKKISKNPMPFMHHHHTYEIFYITRGGREYFIEDGFFKLGEGDAVIIPREVLHRTDGSDASRILIYFSHDYIEKFFTAKTLGSLATDRPLVFRPSDGQKEHFASLFNAIYAEYARASKEGTVEDDPIIAGYLYQIIFMLTNGKNAYICEKYNDGRIEKVVRYINENYSRINDIDEIAERFYISKYHLCRIFKQNLGVGLIGYLNTIKVRHACELICSAGYTLTEVSCSCGFNSPSYFCKVFKAQTGISPTEYKKQHAGAADKNKNARKC